MFYIASVIHLHGGWFEPFGAGCAALFHVCKSRNTLEAVTTSVESFFENDKENERIERGRVDILASLRYGNV